MTTSVVGGRDLTGLRIGSPVNISDPVWSVGTIKSWVVDLRLIEWPCISHAYTTVTAGHQHHAYCGSRNGMTHSKSGFLGWRLNQFMIGVNQSSKSSVWWWSVVHGVSRCAQLVKSSFGRPFVHDEDALLLSRLMGTAGARCPMGSLAKSSTARG